MTKKLNTGSITIVFGIIGKALERALKNHIQRKLMTSCSLRYWFNEPNFETILRYIGKTAGSIIHGAGKHPCKRESAVMLRVYPRVFL
jgi:hypothetical protein